MSEITLKEIIEGALLVSKQPLSLKKLKQLFNEQECPEDAEFKAALEELAQNYRDNRAMEFKEVSSGFRLQVREHLTPWLHRLWEEKPQRFSKALLETLAIIAYRQPITRGDIEAVRGVVVSTQIMKSLLEMNWVRIVGHKEVPGRPALYATTKELLDHLGLKRLEDLPPLSELETAEHIDAQVDAALAELGMPGLGDTEKVMAAEANAEQATTTESEEQQEGQPHSLNLQESELEQAMDATTTP